MKYSSKCTVSELQVFKPNGIFFGTEEVWQEIVKIKFTSKNLTKIKIKLNLLDKIIPWSIAKTCFVIENQLFSNFEQKSRRECNSSICWNVFPRLWYSQPFSLVGINNTCEKKNNVIEHDSITFKLLDHGRATIFTRGPFLAFSCVSRARFKSNMTMLPPPDLDSRRIVRILMLIETHFLQLGVLLIIRTKSVNTKLNLVAQTQLVLLCMSLLHCLVFPD